MAQTVQLSVTADTSAAERALGSLSNGLRTLAALAGANQIIKLADTFTNLNNKLGATSESQEQFNTAIKAVQKIATETGTPLNDVANLYTKLSITGKQAGVSQEQILRAVESTTKALKVYGIEQAAASSFLYQFGQATGFAAIRYEEWNQMMEASPPLVRDIASAFGKTTQQMTSDIQQALVGAGDLIRAQEYLLANKIGPMWKNYQKTVSDSFTSINNNFSMFLGRLESSTGIFSKIANSLDWLGKNLDLVIAALGAFFVIFSVQKVLAIAEAMTLLSVAISRNPLIALGTAVLAAGGALLAYLGVSKEAEKVLNKEADAQAKLNKEVLKYEGPKIDAEALKGQLTAFMKQYDLKLRIANMTQVQGEYEQALFKFATDQKLPLDAVRNIVGETLKARIESVVIAEQQKKIELEYSSALEASNSIMLLMGENNYAYMNARDKILQLEREIGIVLTAQQAKRIIETEELKLQKSQLLEIAAVYDRKIFAQTGSQAGASFMNNLPSLSNAAALKEQETLQQTLLNGAKWIHSKLLIDDQQYEEAKLSIKQQYLERTLALEQANAERSLKISGVTNQAIITSVKDQMSNVQMMQQGGVVGAQGVLGALDNVFASMSAHNKKAFETHKALATAQAVISTYQAAAAALAMPPGPPISLIYVAGAIAAGFAQVAAIQGQQYSGRALGGSVSGNSPYIVGEKGPEMFVPAGSGTIVPNSELKGGGPVAINFTIQANDAQGFDDLLHQRKGMITQFVRDAMQEQGQRSRM